MTLMILMRLFQGDPTVCVHPEVSCRNPRAPQRLLPLLGCTYTTDLAQPLCPADLGFMMSPDPAWRVLPWGIVFL